MIEFETEKEREDWLVTEANRITNWEKGLTWFNKTTGKDEPTAQALNARSFEEAYKQAEHHLWTENIPVKRLDASYIKIRKGLSIQEYMGKDYLPCLRVNKYGKDLFISNCKVDINNCIKVIYSGVTTDITNTELDKVFLLSDSSDNPLRPFRWYRHYSDNTLCVMTTTEEEIHVGRMEAFNSYLEELDNPEYITIFTV